MEESKELLPADHDAFVGPRSPPVARGGGAREGMERGLSRREKARRGGGRKEERGGTGESKEPGDKRWRTGDETGKATVLHHNQPPLSRLSPPLFSTRTIFVFPLFLFFLFPSTCYQDFSLQVQYLVD